jgi:hypothetical protein
MLRHASSILDVRANQSSREWLPASIRAVTPAPFAELFDSEREQFLIHLEAELHLSALDVFFG